MNIKPTDRVRVKRDIYRYAVPNRRTLYARSGEEGRVEEVFFNMPPSGGVKSKKQRRYYAKVRIGGEVKTFRLTSLEVVRPTE